MKKNKRAVFLKSIGYFLITSAVIFGILAIGNVGAVSEGASMSRGFIACFINGGLSLTAGKTGIALLMR